MSTGDSVRTPGADIPGVLIFPLSLEIAEASAGSGDDQGGPERIDHHPECNAGYAHDGHKGPLPGDKSFHNDSHSVTEAGNGVSANL
jgi:hypothetical protein